MTETVARQGISPLLRTGERTSVRIDLTPRASRQVRSLLAAREGEPYGLRISADESPAAGGAYRLSLAPQPYPGDLVLPRNGFAVFVPGEQAARLDGVRIDFVESPTSAGFVVDPPARPPRPRQPWGDGSGQAGPDGVPAGFGCAGTVPGPVELVAEVEGAIAGVRPALQADGGDLALVGVDGDTAYVALSGACSGCSSALVTLTELVERVIVEAVPGIDRVVLAS